MKESDKNIENLIDKMMSETTLETPSIGFTSTIMSQVLVVEKSKIKAYKPLISKSIWVFIGLSIVALTVYLSLAKTTYNVEMGNVYLDRMTDLFSGIHFSKKTLYAILIVPVMILVQITLLKNYYDKKYQL